ncbi:hypothetical protein FHR36_001536 [Kitasatospora paracochleata]|uniref:ADP-ribose pyrophosphatase n=1 Tax=Kitasatospora paracochleata TaxID=58354 RepID=A0ABT1ITG4_9ACTN|nr:hypothetical protein [Kitasatospora paracochleata]
MNDQGMKPGTILVCRLHVDLRRQASDMCAR